MNLYTHPELSSEKDKQLWENAVIVLDTSALCSLYNLSNHYRDIIVRIFKHFQHRLWLPYQVKYEYRKNRIKAISNPINEKYKTPLFIKSHLIEEINEQINQWEKNKYYHPFIDIGELVKLRKYVADAKKQICAINDIVKAQYNKRKEEIFAVKETDELNDFIDTIPTSKPLSFKDVFDIIKEGDFRYRNELPPGYMDARAYNGKKPKEGINKYGDLIVWKDIMSYSSTVHKDVIFIIDDKKEDWFDHNLYKGSPRVELLAEFNEVTGNDIWFYTTQQFIEELKKHYHEDEPTLPFYDELENVNFVLERIAWEKKMESLHSGEKMILQCDKCHKKFPVWSECLEWVSQSLNGQNWWYGHCDLECPFCNSSISIDSTVTEFPLGEFDSEDTCCDEAEIILPWCLENEFRPLFESEFDNEDYDDCEQSNPFFTN